LVALCYQEVLCDQVELYDWMVLYDQEVLSYGDQADGHGGQEVVPDDLVVGHGDQVVDPDDRVGVLCDQVVEDLCNQEEDPWEVLSHAYLCEEEDHLVEVLPVLEESVLVGLEGSHMVAG